MLFFSRYLLRLNLGETISPGDGRYVDRSADAANPDRKPLEADSRSYHEHREIHAILQRQELPWYCQKLSAQLVVER
jgi:hypothetical protein